MARPVVNVRFLVPRREDGGHRDRLWEFCRRYWSAQTPWRIVEGHHDDGPFNRSKALNTAARGGWDVAVVLDADVIVDTPVVLEAAERAAATGRLVLPHRHRFHVSATGTERILNGYQGSWKGWVVGREGERHVSSCVVVPRPLWDAVGGFDERFEGWGGEDDAFVAACSALTGVERLPHAVWHLHHPPSPWRNHHSPLYRQAKALADRYIATTDPAAMRRLLAEPRTPDQVVVVCLTNGRRETLWSALASAEEMIGGPVGRRVVVGDHCEPRRDGWDTVRVQGGNYCAAVGRAIDVAVGSGQPWVFWLEDDFTFDDPVDLAAMQAVMEAEPRIAQMSLMRQAWYGPEVAAGGVIPAYGSGFTQRDGWVEHRNYWTFNPMLCRRSLLASHEWSRRPPHGEARFGQAVFSDPSAVAGVWGAVDDPPRVRHIGTVRAGRGY